VAEVPLKRVLVSGANGFVGRAVCRSLLRQGWQVRGAVRSTLLKNFLEPGVEMSVVHDLGPHTDWTHALTDVDAVVHCAARVHMLSERAADAATLYHRTNTAGTARLADMSVQFGVRRFLYMSSLKVLGEESGHRLSASDVSEPHDPYARSKWDAEQFLIQLATRTPLEVVIVRPPLVYGPGVKANFLALLGLVRMGVPLPLASIRNVRSFLYVENLADAIVRCLTHPKAAGETFLLSDDDDVSTPELLRRLGDALGVRVRLVPFSPRILSIVAHVVGKTNALRRLTGSLSIDPRHIKETLDWKPPYSMDKGLKATAVWYLECRNKPTPISAVSLLKRLFDILLAAFLLIIFALPMLVIALLVRWTSKGPAFHWSDRVGMNNAIFRMPKFRTMYLGTPQVATHLLKDPEASITPMGRFLRKRSLDELPQLLIILTGAMSFVGPRPALYNQDDLMALRTERGVHHLLPGLTGWAQVNGRDRLSVAEKVEYDAYYLTHRSIWFDVVIIAKTLQQSLLGVGVVH